MTITQTIYGFATGALMLAAMTDLAYAQDIPNDLICSFQDLTMTSNNGMAMLMLPGMVDEAIMRNRQDPEMQNFPIDDVFIAEISGGLEPPEMLWDEASDELMIKLTDVTKEKNGFMEPGDYITMILTLGCEE